MHLMKVAALAVLLPGTAFAADYSLSFAWGDIPSCSSGNPYTVGSPEFVVKNLPAGTTTVVLKLKDLDAPNYNHGGARLKMSQSGTIPAGVFKYKSPCPPNGVHTYEWSATAKAGSKTLGVAKARRDYPE